MRSANSRRIWVSDTGNPHLSETADPALYDPSYNTAWLPLWLPPNCGADAGPLNEVRSTSTIVCSRI